MLDPFGLFPGISRMSIFNKNKIARLLNTDKKALKAFEKSYKEKILDDTEEAYIENARQAKEAARQQLPEASLSTGEQEKLDDLVERIVNELLAEADIYRYDRNEGVAKETLHHGLPDGTMEISNREVSKFPLPSRPQLTGKLMTRDINGNSYEAVLDAYLRYVKEKNPERKKQLYGHFRQGLDILDIDPILYEIIGTNPNSIGHWFPQLVEAISGQDFFKIPSTTIIRLPMTLLQLTRVEYMSLTSTTRKIVNQFCMKAFKLDEAKEYFVKTGTYSSKFDFRNAYVHGAKEVRELGEYLLWIHFDALQMASFIYVDAEGRLHEKPSLYGVSTTNEWVCREFIKDKENNPTIYKGLPLHTEYRVFVDCSEKRILGISPYWEPNLMKDRFSKYEDANSPHQIHDYIIFQMHEPVLMKRYEENKERVVRNVECLLPNLNLEGQWSIDIMQNGDDFWIIDMGLAKDSALKECIPKELLKSVKENWIPELKKLEI